jgi:CheY-like chemotaxis protein
VDAGPAEAIEMIDPPAQTHHTSAANSPAAVIRLKPAKILVVEDGTSNQKLITIVLQRAGVTVELANNGQIGFDKAMAGKYDLILMDMQMPVMDGFTATRRLREQGCTLPIIALTANAMKGEEEKCRAAGCSGYLSKPIDVDLLLRTVSEIVGKCDAGEISPTPPVAPSRVTSSTPKDIPMLESTLPIEDPDFLEIVQEFADRLHEQIAEMQKAWERQELSQLASLAHWLKGSGGTAGFNAFTDPAARLEKSAKERRLDEIAAALADVSDLGSRVVRPQPKAAMVTTTGD